MLLRAYCVEDAAATLAVFERAVRLTASADYGSRQVSAWLGADRDLVDWNTARLATTTQVAVIGERIAGFVDVNHDGYIDMLFVDPNRQRQGVASALLDWTEATATAIGASQLSAFVSITARPVFEAHGFVVHQERVPVVHGVPMKNFHMIRQLAG
jgi:putative acetyltransferase